MLGLTEAQDSVVVNTSKTEAMLMVIRSLERLGMNIKAIDVKHGTIGVQTSLSTWSYGELVIIRCIPSGLGTTIAIYSECAYRRQKYDGGKNKKNVQSIKDSLCNFSSLRFANAEQKLQQYVDGLSREREKQQTNILEESINKISDICGRSHTTTSKLSDRLEVAKSAISKTDDFSIGEREAKYETPITNLSSSVSEEENPDADVSLSEEPNQEDTSSDSSSKVIDDAQIEEEIRLAEEAKAECEARLAEEARLLALKKEEEARGKEERSIHLKKVLLGLIVAALSSILMYGVYLINKDNIMDHVMRYEKAGKAIILFDGESKNNPHLIYMDKKGVFYDDMKSVSQLLPVGQKLNASVLHCTPKTEEGIVPKSVDLPDHYLEILSSSNLHLTEIAPKKTFLISTNSKISVSSLGGNYRDFYFLRKNINDYEITYISNGKIVEGEYGGYAIEIKDYGNLLSAYNDYFKSKFTTEEFKTLSNYTSYEATIGLNLNNGIAQIKGDISLPNLSLRFPANNIGKASIMTEICEELYTQLRGTLSLRQIKQIIPSANKSSIHSSSDGKYTFVIDADGSDKNDKYNLKIIENKTRKHHIVDSGMSIAFESNRIKITKHDTFLLIFDSSKVIYYDYYGRRLY